MGGPAPKTAIQEDVPNFFSPENVESIVADIKITPLRIAIGLTGSASPAIAKKKVDTLRDDKIKAEAKAAKDKATAEAAAKKAAADKAAEVAKAAADKAAVAAK